LCLLWYYGESQRLSLKDLGSQPKSHYPLICANLADDLIGEIGVTSRIETSYA
jgi:hypothetical protein